MRAILTYHSVDPSGSPISIDERAFRAHVAWLATGVVRVVPLDQIANADTPDDAVALTFDDAFQNFADIAWPMLRDHAFPVTLFVVSGHVGRTNDWGGKAVAGIPTLPLMSWDALDRAAAEGVTLGAHSRSHPDLRQVDDATLADELTQCAESIAAHTTRPDAFAYPYGAVDDRVAAAARGVFKVAVTTELRELDGRDDPLRLPRLDAFYFADDGRLEAWGTPSFRNHLRLRAGLRRVRAAFTGRPA